MLKAIVFDFDGVVVDSEPVHFEAMLEVSRSIGHSFTYDDYLRDLIGFDDRDAFRFILIQARQEVTDAKVRALCLAKQDAFDRLAGKGVKMIPGARELIETASQRLPIAIASGATRRDIELMLGGLGLRDHFALIVSADDVAASKPHPETYALAADRLASMNPKLDLTRADCLAIEDTAAGIESARAAGLMTLAITTTSSPDALTRARRVEEDLTGVTVDRLAAWYEG